MKKILIVEDEKEIRNILKVYLLTAGYEVTEAADGEEAMRIFYEKPFDLVVLDIMLPKKDGWSICREIKEYSSVPVIIITARDNENDEVFGFEIGADDYIIKPFSINVLSTKIKKYLKLNIQQEYNFIESVINGAAVAIGFTLALVLLAGIRERIEYAAIPGPFKGVPIAFISAGLLAMAFMGFSGMQI